MIRKLLEAFFSHKLLLLLPPFLITAIVAPVAFATTTPVYETSVGIWVDQPTYLQSDTTGNPYVSGVANDSSRLSELLRTRAFIDDVAQRTSLAPLLGSPAGEARVADVIGRGVTTITAGDHLLVIRVQAANPQLALGLCQAVVDAYQEKTSADRSDQLSLAVSYYQSRMTEAQKNLTQSSANLRRYNASQADSGDPTQAADPGALPSAMVDPKLAALQTSVQTAQADYNNAQSSLAQAQRDYQVAIQGQEIGFQVLDPPTLPTAPTSQLKKIIVYPIAGLIAGLALSAMLLVVLVAGDHTVRSEADLAPGLRVLGTVPVLRFRRVPKRLRGVAARRAIGAVAGTALPAPSGSK